MGNHLSDSLRSDNMRLLAGALLLAVCATAMAQFVDPCKQKTRTSAHETQCDAYYECFNNGDPVLQYCPNGLVYNGSKKRGLLGVCDYDHKVDCYDRPERNPPISTEHCDWLYGIFGHETSCTRYWTCWNGTATEQFCIGGLLYNEETHACDWPSNVAGCQKHPLCTEDPDANVPLGSSCERYWACQGGYPRLQRCPATLVFDKQSRRCVPPPTVDCEVPTTTEPPIDESNNFRDGQSGGSGGRQGGRNPVSRPRPSQPRPVQRGQQQQSQQPINIAPATSQDRPFVPAGAIPVQFNEPQPQGGFEGNNFRPQQGQQQQNFRPPPIQGAIPLN